MHQRVAGVAVFEADSAKRIAARYFESSLKSFEAQIAFEKSVILKASKSSSVLAAAAIGQQTTSEKDGGKDAEIKRMPSAVEGSEQTEIVLVDNYIVLLKLVNDILIAVIADETQNDLLMNEYMTTLTNAFNGITNNAVSKKKLYDRLDQVFLVLDESLDDGALFELDAAAIVARISMNDEPGAATPTAPGQPGAGRPISASTAMREGIAAISRGDTDSLRSVFAGAAQTFSNFLGR